MSDINIKKCLLKNHKEEPCVKDQCKYWHKYFKNCIFYSGGFIR